MPLSEAQRVRYARHLLLPELGEQGQLRLLAGSVRFARGGQEGAREVAGEYLRRAGVRVIEDEDAHAGVPDDTLLLAPPELNCDTALNHAAAALSGAFTAVEAIKRLAGIGKAAELDRNLLRAEEV